MNKNNLRPSYHKERILNLTSEEDLKVINKAIKNMKEKGREIGISFKSLLKNIK